MRLLGLLLAAVATLAAQPAKEFQSNFTVNKKNLGITGNNPFFPLAPGYVLSYRHGKDTDTLTVLSEVKVIDGVQTRVVEDRELKNGALVELTRDYYAIDSATNDVYYMGEDVDVYKRGKVVSHEGSWLSGVKGAKFGLMMPGAPKIGHKFYQEQAPGVTRDRAEILSVNEKVTTPAGTFEHCVHTLEGRDHKWYAPGVGQIKDAEMLLIKYTSR